MLGCVVPLLAWQVSWSEVVSAAVFARMQVSMKIDLCVAAA